MNNRRNADRKNKRNADRLGTEVIGMLWDRWRGLALYAVDGTSLRVPDSEANRHEFGLIVGRVAPQGVRQELWGVLLAYNLVRREMEQVTKEANVSPLRISFVASGWLRLLKDCLAGN